MTNLYTVQPSGGAYWADCDVVNLHFSCVLLSKCVWCYSEYQNDSMQHPTNDTQGTQCQFSNHLHIHALLSQIHSWKTSPKLIQYTICNKI